MSLGVLLPSSAQAITLIDTTPSWDGSSNITSFGGTATYGQTVTTPAVDNVLNSFSFILGDTWSGTPITFKGYVSQWDGSKATGPILYSSGDKTYSGGGFQTYDFNTGSLALTPGQQYVLFLNASSSFATSGATGQALIDNSQTYSGGKFVFSNNDADFGALTTTDWDSVGFDFGDSAFTASFSSSPVSVPWETDALPVVGSTILFGLGLWSKRKFEKNKYSQGFKKELANNEF
ncbi:hypothetical protein PN450_13015 [Dolichospermum lemmermannii CS-548]|uniref:hypothetical protein n=1 Tax=Dolichospermum lemmermannii TaxID=54295 RepID=UPI00232AC8CC|nr:hypothetical protein [Dolichospermum lemmermannii]MDB9437692.1 hypothetical protein [Dolichospermum lemmermannii CS-548]